MANVGDILTDNLGIWTSAIERRSSAGRGRSKKFSLYGIEKLRALVFDLAALGKIIDAPAVTPTKLGKHVELVMGQAPPGDKCNTSGAGTIFVKTGEFGPLYPKIIEWTTSPLKMAKLGDVLICVVGATIGKLNLAIDCAIGRSVAAIRPRSHIDTKFLYYSLFPYTIRLRSGSRGSAQGVIGKDDLNAIAVRVPPLAEQQRIVAKVDELMALCDALEAETYQALEAHELLVANLLATLTRSADANELSENWTRIEMHFDTLFTTEASIDQLKQTILQLAVMGKLVPQDPNDEPASELLKRIAVAKSGRKNRTGDARIKVALNPKPSALEISLPSGWAVQSFENLFLFIDYRGNTPPKTEEGIPLITAKNIRMGHLNREPYEYISTETFESWMTRGFPEIGDLFFTTEAPLGNVCLNNMKEPFALAQRAICLQPYAEMNTKFLMYALMSQTMQSLIDKHATGMTAKGIKASNLKPLPIPIPPIAEQHRIVEKIDQLAVCCEVLKCQLAEGQRQQVQFADAVASKAVA